MNWLSKLSFRTRMLGIVGIACVICAAASLGFSIHFNDKDREAGIIAKSLTIHSRLEAATEYVATQGGLKTAIERFTQKYKDPKEMSPDDKLDVLKQVPIFAAMKIGAKDSAKEHYQFRIFSDEPRKKENLATSEELKILKEFEANPSLHHKVEKTGKLITVYRPVRLAESQGCLYCHGDPSSSPWKNGQDVLGFKMENWKDGKLHGVFAIISDKDEIVKAEAALTTVSNTTMLALMIGVAALISLFLAAFLLRKPIESISQVASVLSGVSNAVLNASTQIADSADNLSQAATEQAASIEETSASIEEVSAMVKKTSENAIDTANTSKASESKAKHGSEVVEKMVASMREIDESNNSIMEQVKQSNAQMAEIVKVIHEIGGKTKVINDIVFQTKLLSFNASVEAARAGEHGKGFAVVAEEVGNLAQMSGNASKEISSMLDGSIGKVESIARETQTKVEQLIAEGKSKVDLGVNVAHECGEVLKEIVANVGDASRLANEISTASGEQATGVAEIAKAMTQLSQVTHENTATAQASADSADQLSEQARALQSSVHSLLETIHGMNGDKGATTQTPAAPTSPRKKNNVVPIKRASASVATPAPVVSHTGYKRVAGDPVIPNANDPAFEDV